MLITKSDKKKFLFLLKAGFKNGKLGEVKSFTLVTKPLRTDTPKQYFVSLKTHFTIDAEFVEELISEDHMDNEIAELFKDIDI